MSRPRGLHWTSTRDLFILGNEAEKSVNSSMNNFNSQCPTTCLKMKPTYLTDEVLNAVREVVQNQNNLDPMIIVDIEAHKVVIEFVTMTGPDMGRMTVVTRWELVESYKYQNSGQIFLGFIAFECYEMIKHFWRCFGTNGPQTVFCSIIFHFEFNQTSLKDSKVDKFAKDFHVEGCVNRDLVQMFNHQLMALSYYNSFRIVCTHMMNNSIPAMAGYCLQQNVQQPDILVLAELSSNIQFFENIQLEGDEQPQKMLINTEICKFGESIGSTEYNLLLRFISRQDFEINDLEFNHLGLYDLFITGYQMCQIALRFLRKKVPDFSISYNWLDLQNAVGIQDISDLLESVHLNCTLSGSLRSVYNNLDDETRKEFSELCADIRDRSASMMAGLVFATMKRVSLKSNKRKLVIALAGELMQDMFQYRDKFESALEKVLAWHKRRNGEESSIEAEFVYTPNMSSNYGMMSMAKYIRSVHH